MKCMHVISRDGDHSEGWGAPCFGGRTISFLVKFESFVLCKLEPYISHLGYFGSKFSKKIT